jgi:hypothetical protein
MPNVLCTPHLGWAEWTNFELYFREAFEQIVAYEQGLPMRLGNPACNREIEERSAAVAGQDITQPVSARPRPGADERLARE